MAPWRPLAPLRPLHDSHLAGGCEFFLFYLGTNIWRCFTRCYQNVFLACVIPEGNYPVAEREIESDEAKLEGLQVRKLFLFLPWNQYFARLCYVSLQHCASAHHTRGQRSRKNGLKFLADAKHEFLSPHSTQ